ncbi:MAG: hypothetical protein NC121_12635 [Blautia sp.]|nr:hypothetical protein [Blautia sp.]
MEESKNSVLSNREVKSGAFTTYFSDPQNAAQLYAALDGVEVNPEEIRFMTLESVLFVARKNDLAFTVQNKVLVISEHQSTINFNMPLRSAIYYGRTMEKLVENNRLYQRRKILIPTPEFYIFYNGDERFPPEKILKLSDSYLESIPEPMLELSTKVININLPVNHGVLGQCRPLYEYSWFIERIKEYIRRGNDRDTAIQRTVKDCEENGIMTKFMREHGSEVSNMLFTQFNMEDALKANYEEGFEDGEEKGKMLQLIQLVCRKIQKGKDAAVIAEELEEDIEPIRQICAVVEQCGLNAGIEKIYSVLRKDPMEDDYTGM